ncbi:DDE superfamily endonuclease domain-containing protein [Apiospora arundinis]
MAFRLNYNVEIRQCADVEKGLGLFAVHRLTKGLKIIAEAPLLVDETRDDLARNVVQQFSSLPPDGQAVLIRMYAGHNDVNPMLPPGVVRDTHAVRPSRLSTIARLNGLEGIGIGCALSPGAVAINHDCTPNAFVYYNANTNSVTLHALRDIQMDEEISISYFQESVYLTKAERHGRLVN